MTFFGSPFIGLPGEIAQTNDHNHFQSDDDHSLFFACNLKKSSGLDRTFRCFGARAHERILVDDQDYREDA